MKGTAGGINAGIAWIIDMQTDIRDPWNDHKSLNCTAIKRKLYFHVKYTIMIKYTIMSVNIQSLNYYAGKKYIPSEYSKSYGCIQLKDRILFIQWPYIFSEDCLRYAIVIYCTVKSLTYCPRFPDLKMCISAYYFCWVWNFERVLPLICRNNRMFLSERSY